MSDRVFSIFMVTFIIGFLSLTVSGVIYNIGDELDKELNSFGIFAPGVLLLGTALGTVIVDLLIGAIQEMEIKTNRRNLSVIIGVSILAVVAIGVPIAALLTA